VSPWGWALTRALEYAVATAVVGLLLATLLPGADSERFASTGYVAAIVAAVVLAIKWFVPGAPGDVRTSRAPTFPAIFTFSLGVAALLIAGGALIDQPSAEVRAVVICFVLIGAAALVRGGALRAFHKQLAEGDRLTSAIRYAAVVGIAALALCALFAPNAADALPRFGYAALAFITLMLAAQLIAPTRLGAWAQRAWNESAYLLRTPVSVRVFARTLQYALGVAIAALILAGVTPEAYAERFATTAYLAMLFALFALVMLHGHRLATDSHWDHVFEEPARFAAVLGAALVVGAALAFSPIAEMLAACVFLYAIGASIATNARRTIHPE
jgi:hypothetical protein